MSFIVTLTYLILEGHLERDYRIIERVQYFSNKTVRTFEPQYKGLLFWHTFSDTISLKGEIPISEHIEFYTFEEANEYVVDKFKAKSRQKIVHQPKY